jgi:two-component system cell cycle response regulator
VRQAGSCAEAQVMLDEAVELIILSLSLTDDDPLRLVSQWRTNEAFRQLPILLLADEGELPRLAKGLDLGANDYLIRPVDRNELLARVRSQVRRKRLQDRLHENYRRSLSLALTDELTGLYNRRYVVAHLEELLIRKGGDGPGDTALMMFDVDHFKAVNDQYGHPAGDDALRQLADRALRGVRSIDLVARLGGEEFVVVMPETDLNAAIMVAERLRHSVAGEPFLIHAIGERRPVTISIGVAIAAPGDTVDTLLQRADDALYEAKNGGRNKVVAAKPVTLRFAAAS